ncbi:putative protein kinase TKL-Pl-5 family [Helianthus annuus]|nr:putative protein kinase TKL-Pl-5 family [Helianthus annuus]
MGYAAFMGMTYPHHHKPLAIIHRDLTPRKSFRNALQDEVGRLKVTDIGLSKTTHEKDVYGYKMSGPFRYMDPS